MADSDKKDDKKDAPAEDAARAALVAAADGDENDPRTKAAKRALAAYDADADGDDKDKDKDKADAQATTNAAASLAATVQAQGAKIASLEATLTAERAERAKASEAAARAEFLATRPELSTEVKASLEGLPLERVKQIVNAIPKASNPLAVAPEVGAVKVGLTPTTPASNPQLAAQMGLVEFERRSVVSADGIVQSFGVPVVKGSK